VVFGTQRAIEQVLAAGGWTINTSFVERLNLDLRQRVAAIGRRVNTLCQGEAGLRDQLSLFQVYHNFVLPYASLRQPLLMPEVPNDNGSASGHPSASPRGSHEHYPQGSGTRPGQEAPMSDDQCIQPSVEGVRYTIDHRIPRLSTPKRNQFPLDVHKCVRRCPLLLENPALWATHRILCLPLSQRQLKIRGLWSKISCRSIL
jgi:hypothetical protein